MSELGPYAIREVAESVIGEDRVPTNALEDIIIEFGSDEHRLAAGFDADAQIEVPRAHYTPPFNDEGTFGTVFDPTDKTFGPIMAAIQDGAFEQAVSLLADLTLPPGAAVRWFDVDIALDEDNLRHYAVQASTENEARSIAMAQLPEPDVSVAPLYVEPDDADIDYDQIIPAGQWEHDA